VGLARVRDAQIVFVFQLSICCPVERDQNVELPLIYAGGECWLNARPWHRDATMSDWATE
jgi:hypothetical protein